MATETLVRIDSDTDIVRARQESRKLAQRLGFSSTEQTLIATALSEVSRNMVQYAGGGEIRFGVVESHSRRGLEITAQDHGPGIPDVELAMQDGYSTGGGLGLGLPGARRLMDDFLLDSQVGRGTTVTMRKWVPA